ncbi:DUF1683 family protein [Tieghemostelium lacteum]|uniref:DUF1683 family protein n=1 Tax=Tieghemostelium lacteum TaxID=361077 RepID=A0A151Z716_TIELA|nr:DUF1683 family protein [Tieghemostelium lacteum]|eukprot:KYQ89761.1 DUF1683 family protein [Tieghemostelium lacteum]
MNELPDDIINLPIPLIGLIGSNNLHFYIEKYITNKQVLEFTRSNGNVQSHITTPLPLSPSISVTSSPVITSTTAPTNVYQNSPSIDPIQGTIIDQSNNNNNNMALLEEVFNQKKETQVLSPIQGSSPVIGSTPPPQILPTVSSPVLGAWKLQQQQVPILKTLTLDIGGVSNKKEKRINHADTFIPLGILKANWIHKHMCSLPSVVSFFIQWPDDKSPKSIDPILTQIDTIKNNLKNRNIKLMIAIIYNSTTIETSDERIIQIRKRSEISDPKYFLFLNKSEFNVFVKKWEKLANELSDQFYKDECNNTKQQITKNTHPFLIIRYHFKIAFYSELRSDYNTALKYYIFAYNSLKDWKPTNDPRGERFQELRSVASIINFKISKLYLWNGNIQEAGQQFDRHLKLFRIYHGPQEKEFTHSAWIAKEYQIFGDLLEACPNNQKLIVTHNPSYYYQIASKYMAIRRKHFQELVPDYVKLNPVISKFRDQKPRYDLSIYQFIGQAPPDTSHPLELTNHTHQEPEVDIDFYKTVAQELNINYSQTIIDLLSKSYEQTLISSNHRILSYIESLIADEYYNSKQYDLAFRYYNKNAITYRREKWWTLLTHSISMLLKCVHYLNIPNSFVNFVMEYLSPKFCNTLLERSRVQDSLIDLLVDSKKLQPPMSLASSLDVRMEHTHPLFNCRVQFPSSFTFTSSQTEFYVVFETHFPKAIRFSKLNVLFSESSYNSSIVDPLPINNYNNNNNKSTERNDLLFLPDESRLFTFHLKTKEKMELECKSVILELQSSDPSISLNFHWNISEWALKSDEINQKDDTSSTTTTPILSSKSHNNNNNTSSNNQNNNNTTHQKPNPYKKFLERSSIRILDHESLIQIKCKHQPPALINEFYEMEMEILNNDIEITKGTVTFEINEKQLYLEPSKSSEILTTLELPHIQEKSTFKKKFYIYSQTDDESKLLINISYETKSGEISHTSKLFNVPVLMGLISQFQYFDDHFQLNDMYEGNLVINEPVFMNLDLKSSLPYAISIEKISLVIANNEQPITPLAPSMGNTGPGSHPEEPLVKLLSISNQSLGSIELVKDMVNYSCWFSLIPLITGESLSFGQLIVEYRRLNSQVVNRLPIQLPPVRVTINPFITTIQVPSQGVVGAPLQHCISIRNNTNFLQEFELIVVNPPSYGSTDVPFFFSGEKVSSFMIHPECNHEIKHTLLPLVAGKHPLPHFKITSKRFNKELPKTKNTNNYLFIKPNFDLAN